MPAALSVRDNYTASQLRRLAARARNASQSRRLLALAAVRDGMNRSEAARIGGMDRQTLRDWCTASMPKALRSHPPEQLINVIVFRNIAHGIILDDVLVPCKGIVLIVVDPRARVIVVVGIADIK